MTNHTSEQPLGTDRSNTEPSNTERKGMVIGIDGTPASVAAARWAMAHTDAFGPIRPVYTWSIPAMAIAGTPLGFAPAPPVAEMEAAAERAAAVYAEDLGLDPADITVVQGDPGTVLCELATDASLLVVGTRNRGTLRANFLGSVGRYCADHTPVPLIIVPADSEQRLESDRPVVVGVDGSSNSLSALRWAATAFNDAPITAVTSWQTPVDGPVMFGGGRFDLKAFRAQAATVAEETVAKASAELGIDEDRFNRKVVEGDPRWTLHSEQPDAGLLVVGQRGRGGLAHLVLGSTTTSLIHRPDCPIAVIPCDTDNV